MNTVGSYNEVLKGMNITSEQRESWSNLCGKVNSGELTMNQAYKHATTGWSNANGDDQQAKGSSDTAYRGSFSDWMQTAKDEGWIDNIVTIGSNIASGVQQNQSQSTSNWNPNGMPIDNTRNTTGQGQGVSPWIWVGASVALVAIGFAIVKASKNKEN